MSARLLSGNSGRKGQFFSLIAMMLLLLLAMQLSGSEKPVLLTEAESTETSFEIAVNLLHNVETAILPRMLDADVGTALDGIARCLNDSEAAATDEADHAARAQANCEASNNGFYEDETKVMGIVRNATLGLPVPSGVAPYVSQANINAQLDSLQKFVPKTLKFQLRILPGDMSVWQDNTSGPNGLNVRMSGTLDLTADFANWTGRVIEPNSTVAIDGLLDPYIMVQVTKSLKTVTPAPANLYRPQVSYYVGNLTALTLPGIALNRTYQFEPLAPSFISRFTGNMSDPSDCCGIESLIALNPVDGSDEGIPAAVGLRRRPMVDWCYWREHADGDVAWCTEPSFASDDPERQKIAVWLLHDVSDGAADILTTSPTFFSLESYHLQKYVNESITDYVSPDNECSCNMSLCSRVFNGPGCNALPAGGDDTCDWFGPPAPGTCGTPPTP